MLNKNLPEDLSQFIILHIYNLNKGIKKKERKIISLISSGGFLENIKQIEMNEIKQISDKMNNKQ